MVSYFTTCHVVYSKNEIVNFAENVKDPSSEKLMTMMSILSTLFAVFFVYSGFKIDSTKDKIRDIENRIIDKEKQINEEIFEYARQLEYCMSFIVQKKFDKAIDSLSVLSKEYFVLKDGRKLNTCFFFLAHTYYERGCQDNNLEDVSNALRFIDLAREESDHPFKVEILAKFSEMSYNI